MQLIVMLAHFHVFILYTTTADLLRSSSSKTHLRLLGPRWRKSMYTLCGPLEEMTQHHRCYFDFYFYFYFCSG
jgi:hypothetical protein